jgi:hypothetical protein
MLSHVRGNLYNFVKRFSKYDGFFIPRPTNKLGDHTRSAVRNCCFTKTSFTLRPQLEGQPYRDDKKRIYFVNYYTTNITVNS